MRVKFNGEISKLWSLIGGGPQGTLIGGIEYIAQSNDSADVVSPDDRFKYIDDLYFKHSFYCNVGGVPLKVLN